MTVDDVCCGIGATASAVRLLNGRKRARAEGAADHTYVVICATDADTGGRCKTELYNSCLLPGETAARPLYLESAAAMAEARRIAPLVTVCGLPCDDLSALGLQEGAVEGATSACFVAFFERLALSRPPLVVLEEVESLLHAPNADTLSLIRASLRRLGYHFRFRVLNSASLGAAQQRKRVYFVCALNPAVLAAFVFPSRTHKARSTPLARALLPPGSAPESLYLAGNTKVARALSRPPPDGLAPPARGAVYSRVASVFDEEVRVLSRARACAATITASAGSGLYLWESSTRGACLRRLAGVEALHLFTFSEAEAARFAAGAARLGVSSLRLAEIAGDSMVVVVVARLMRSLVDAFSRVAGAAEKAPFLL